MLVSDETMWQLHAERLGNLAHWWPELWILLREAQRYPRQLQGMQKQLAAVSIDPTDQKLIMDNATNTAVAVREQSQQLEGRV